MIEIDSLLWKQKMKHLKDIAMKLVIAPGMAMVCLRLSWLIESFAPPAFAHPFASDHACIARPINFCCRAVDYNKLQAAVNLSSLDVNTDAGSHGSSLSSSCSHAAPCFMSQYFLCIHRSHT